MSRDIRSYFGAPAKPAAKKSNLTAISSDEEEAKAQPKRAKKARRSVVPSDSDEEKPRVSPGKKAALPGGSEGPKSVSPRDIFGSRPVKRVGPPAVSERVLRKEAEFHADNRFEKTLGQLDAGRSAKKSAEPFERESKDGGRRGEVERSDAGPRAAKVSRSKNEETSESRDSRTELSFEKFKGTERASDVVVEAKEKMVDEYEELVEKKKQRASNYAKYLQRGGARNPGSKTVPKGAENCLAGLIFLVTGIFDSLERDEVDELIQKYGGRTVKSLSKKTDFLVVGDEAGDAKLKKAAELGTKKISEDDLLEMIRTRPPGKAGLVAQPRNSSTSRKRSRSDETVAMSPSPKKIRVARDTESREEPRKEHDLEPVPPDGERQIALVEKYRPTSMGKIIGQHGDKSNAKKLHAWLKNWHKNQRGSVKPAKPNPYAKNDDGAFFKACLLSGPPGVGKTTTAQVVCAELGLDLLEFNASDTRSKSLLKQQVAGILTNNTVTDYFTADSNRPARELSRKHVLLMDEVDGMAGNEDRGGIQELVALIKSTEVPIICICNDRQHPKMRTLANYTYDLRFQKPRIEQIRGAMKTLCHKENIDVTTENIDRLIVSTNQDVRQVINQLSMLAANPSLREAQSSTAQRKKDLRLGPWDVIRKVFSAEEHKTMSIHDKSDLFFHDYTIASLFVQENYLSVTPNAPREETLDRVARSAESLAMGDLMENAVRGSGAWSLLPTQACFSSVIPGTLMSGRLNAQANFPAWLGRNSKRAKFDRLLQEITVHARLATGASKEAINVDYLRHLRDAIVRPLGLRQNEGIDEAITVMNSYHFLREDLESLVEVSLWPGQRDPFQDVDSKVKSAFTRAYNKSSAPAPYLINAAPKKKNTQASQDEGFMDGESDYGNESDEDEDEMDTDKMIKAKKTTTKAAASTSKTTAKSAAKRGRGRARAKY